MLNIHVSFLLLLFGVFAFIMIGQCRADRRSGVRTRDILIRFFNISI